MDYTQLQPLNDKVLVRRMPIGDDGRIVVPEIARELPWYGLVLAVGPGKRDKHGHRKPLDVKPGDQVFWGKWNDHETEEYVIIQEADIRLAHHA